MKIFKIFLLGLITFGAVGAEDMTNFRQCLNTNCTVTRLSASPCPEALDGQPCEIPAGTNMTIIMEYVPRFSVQKPKARFYGVQALIDVPFLGMDPDGCLYTSCPVQANVTQVFNFQIVTSPLYPKGDHLAKLRLWDDSENSKYEDQCCVTFDVKLV